MVDFRYHLVSLIAVFLALAVGIILGAGPLQNSIGTALTDQVNSLRESRDEARADADGAQAKVDAYQRGLDSLRPDLTAGSLEDVSVAVVVLPEADKEDVETHRENLSDAGATVTGTVQLTDAYFSAGQSSYRDALAGQLAEYAEVGDGSTLAKLTNGLVHLLTSDQGDEKVSTLVELYQASDNPLIEISDALSGPADAVVVIGPAAAQTPAYDETVQANVLESLTALGDVPAVLVAHADESGFLAAVRGSDLGSRLSTVDAPEDATSLINVPLAVTQELADATVAWGLDGSANAVIGQKAAVPAEPETTDETEEAPDSEDGEEAPDTGIEDPPNETPVEPTAEAS